MATAIQMPFECFLDTDGTPLNNGKIYIGTVNQNPITNPITVYWDAALTIPASQPIRTLGGFPSRSGTAASVFVTDDYSIIIRNQKDETLFSQLTGSPYSASALLAKIKSVDGSGSGLIAEGLQSVQITDLNFDPTLLGLAVREMRTYASSNAPANPFAGSSATYWTLYLTCVATGEFRLLAIANDANADVYTRTWTGGAWQSPLILGQTILAPTGNITYTATEISPDTRIFPVLSGAATVDISAGSWNRGAKCLVRNDSAAPQTLTLHIRSGGTGQGFDLTILQNEWVYLTWDGTYWLIVGEGFSTRKVVVLTSGTSYTVEAGRTRLKATLIGGGGSGGGGGGGGGTTTSNGGGGGNGAFGGNTTMTGCTTANGGDNGRLGVGGQGAGSTPALIGGPSGRGGLNYSPGATGGMGQHAAAGLAGTGGGGGTPNAQASGSLGRGGVGGTGGNGGAGAGGGGGGGGAAGEVQWTVLSVLPGQAITYAIGAGGTPGGTGGTAGTGAQAGSAGAPGNDGAIIIEY